MLNYSPIQFANIGELKILYIGYWTSAFREDESRIRKDNAPQKFAIVRHIATNILQQDKSEKTGIKNKRLKAGWDNEYLAEVLFG